MSIKTEKNTVDQIINLVEKKTRFDNSTLKIISSESKIVKSELEIMYKPSFIIQKGGGNGKTPVGSKDVSSSKELEKEADDRYYLVNSELSDHIDKWVASNGFNENDLKPADCFRGYKNYAFNFNCENCSAKGKVQCYNCAAGYVNCPECRASGFTKCRKCSSGRVSCSSCSRTGRDSNGNSCYSCGGSGSKVCISCNGAARLVCSRCNGRTKVICGKCGGSSWLTCHVCNGYGRRYLERSVVCNVSKHYSYKCKSDCDKEIEFYLKSLSNDDVKQMGSYTQKPIALKNRNPIRSYDLKSIVSEVKINIGKSNLIIYSYGKKALIVDYKSISEILLKDDLTGFEKSINDTKFSLFDDHKSMIDTTKLLLSSEVNFNIDDRENTYSGSISLDYQKRVRDGLESGFRLLCFSFSGFSFILTIVSSLLSIIGFRCYTVLDYVYIALISLGISVLNYILYELHMRNDLVHRISHVIDESYQKRINELINNDSIVRIRYINLALSILVIVLAYILIYVV